MTILEKYDEVVRSVKAAKEEAWRIYEETIALPKALFDTAQDAWEAAEEPAWAKYRDACAEADQLEQIAHAQMWDEHLEREQTQVDFITALLSLPNEEAMTAMLTAKISEQEEEDAEDPAQSD